MRLAMASTMQPEEFVTRNDVFTDVTTVTHPPLKKFTLDGAVSEGCWTAFQPLVVDGVVCRGVKSLYKKATGSGAEPPPHLHERDRQRRHRSGHEDLGPQRRVG